MEYTIQETRENVKEIFVECDFTDFDGKRVLLKPSFVYPWKADEVIGSNTHPKFCAGVALACKDFGADWVGAGENFAISTPKLPLPARIVFKVTGADKILKGAAEPVYFDEEEHVEVTVDNPFIQEEPFVIPKIWRDADIFISLPKIKTNMYTKVTLSVKNNLGFIPTMNRVLHHTTELSLHKKIADLYKVRPPDFVLADAIWAGEGQGPLFVEPYNLGLIIGGTNGPAVDAISCKLMGFNPTGIEHLKFVSEAGLGTIDLDKIHVVNNGLLARGKKFARADPRLETLSPKIHVIQGKNKVCEAGCNGMLRGSLDPYIIDFGKEGIKDITIIVGDGVDEKDIPVDIDKKTTCIIGDCCKQFKNKGKFLGGCPVLPLDLQNFFARIFRKRPPSVEGKSDVILGLLQQGI